MIEFPLPMSLLMRLVRLLPDALYERLSCRTRRKMEPAKVKR